MPKNLGNLRIYTDFLRLSLRAATITAAQKNGLAYLHWKVSMINGVPNHSILLWNKPEENTRSKVHHLTRYNANTTCVWTLSEYEVCSHHNIQSLMTSNSTCSINFCIRFSSPSPVIIIQTLENGHWNWALLLDFSIQLSSFEIKVVY